MDTQHEPFVRPVRIPDHIPLGVASPPVARAGETGAWELRFVLTQDVAPGADLRVLVHGGRNVKGAFALTQLTDPEGPGYVTAADEAGAPIATDAARSGPGEIALAVSAPGLSAGQRITVTLGSGVRAPADSLSNKVFLLFMPEPEPDLGVPRMNAEPARTLVGACLIHVTGGAPTALKAYVASQAQVGQELTILIRPEDAHGNVACEEPGELQVRVGGEAMAFTRHAVQGTTCCRLDGIRAEQVGVLRLQVEDLSHGLRVVSNPVRVLAGPCEEPGLHWGYIHGHTEMSDGAGTLDNYFTYMRDTLGLDFGALGDHDHLFETSDEMWQMQQEATAHYNEPGRFTTFLGYEWAKWRQNGDGDRNVYYLEDHRPMYRSDEGHCPTPPDLFKAIGDEQAMVIPHHPAEIGNHCDYKDHDLEKERLIEIFSVWGNSERSVNDGNPYPVRPSRHTPGEGADAGEVPAGFVQKALEVGWRAGFTGGGDDHSGHPGDERIRGEPPWRCRGGLLGVYAAENSRQAIWHGLWDRQCYATTGPRIIVRFGLDGMPATSELRLADHPELARRRALRVAVHGTGLITKVEIIRNNHAVHVHEGTGLDAEFRWIDEDAFDAIALPAAAFCKTAFCFYYLRVTQADGDMAWHSPIWISP